MAREKRIYIYSCRGIPISETHSCHLQSYSVSFRVCTSNNRDVRPVNCETNPGLEQSSHCSRNRSPES